MKSKKEQILDLFEIIPIMNRDQIIKVFFSDNSNNKRLCAKYMRELHREKKIHMVKDVIPFACFSRSWRGAKVTGKYKHHLGVVDIYLKLKPSTFVWEPCLGKGKDLPTPDAFLVLETKWLSETKRTPYFIEYQAPGSHWSQREMEKKLARYEKAYRKRLWQEYSATQPILWIVTQKEYKLNSTIKIIQKWI